ncbi:MAG: copper amine oxidase N-terminal domain-containing protein [Clostridia bacterium]|nr:copper amine oxidase N-terminal domain-containing protein [Clostridia bacterium]MBQ6530415.1 copper amine oxidase N-terminal domain-containing protein [Clostridia bacterium]
MKFKKTLCAILAGATLFGATAMAKDNIYAYNKFVSTVLGPQMGYCDFAASFVGHESEYENINDYFSGLISAIYADIDADFDNELVTVDANGVAVYQVEPAGVVFLGDANHPLIANYGDSYANVFTVPVGAVTLIGIETYSKTMNEYNMYFYELNAETDVFDDVFQVHREDNEDGIEEKVWAGGKTYYSYTMADGLKTTVNPEGYADCATAAAAAISSFAPEVEISKDTWSKRIMGEWNDNECKLTAKGIKNVTYIRATGVRFSDKPMVIFEDNSQLEELKVKPDIVTVVLDGQTLQFPLQDPVIIDGRTLVPMRTIFEALGAEVEWIDENDVQSIVATTEDTTINMTINSDRFYVNGEEKALDVPAQLINDKTLVPIRAISESLGCYVGWDEDAKTVIIQSHLDVAETAEESQPEELLTQDDETIEAGEAAAE